LLASLAVSLVGAAGNPNPNPASPALLLDEVEAVSPLDSFDDADAGMLNPLKPPAAGGAGAEDEDDDAADELENPNPPLCTADPAAAESFLSEVEEVNPNPPLPVPADIGPIDGTMLSATAAGDFCVFSFVRNTIVLR
jgi:hypothetical protein